MTGQTKPPTTLPPANQTPRDLATVIDQLAACAPDLAEDLARVKYNLSFTAPEIIGDRWWGCAHTLNDRAQTHPKADDLRNIFAGSDERTSAVAPRPN